MKKGFFLSALPPLKHFLIKKKGESIPGRTAAECFLRFYEKNTENHSFILSPASKISTLDLRLQKVHEKIEKKT